MTTQGDDMMKTVTVNGKNYIVELTKTNRGAIGHYYAVMVGNSQLTGFSAGTETDAISEAKAHIADKVPA